MPTIEQYNRVAKVRNASIEMDAGKQELVTRSRQGTMLGRAVSRVQRSVGDPKVRNEATWNDFIGTLDSHYDSETVQPLVQELRSAMKLGKPLTTKRVSATIKKAEQLMGNYPD